MIKDFLITVAIWLTALIIIMGVVKVSDAQTASYYSYGMSGRKTANGERFDPNAFTAAHPTLPFGTRVKVTNIHNGESVIVRINDRGPYAAGRSIDLSYAAAEQIDMIKSGVAEVEIVVLS